MITTADQIATMTRKSLIAETFEFVAFFTVGMLIVLLFVLPAMLVILFLLFVPCEIAAGACAISGWFLTLANPAANHKLFQKASTIFWFGANAFVTPIELTVAALETLGFDF